MIDNDMTNILKNFDSADTGAGTVTDAKTGEQKVSTAATEKNAMKSLLEGLDAAQRSVNQMPATHKMAKNGAKHPASKFLVGGEHDEDGDAVEKPWEADAEVVSDEDWDDKWLVNNESQDGKASYKKTYSDEYDFGVPPSRNAQEKVHSKFKPGVKVHIGHMTPGGSGVVGKVTKVEGDKVYIVNDEGQTYSGYLSNTTLAETTVTEDSLRSVKVTYSNGDTITTDMAAGLSDEDIRNYYAIGKRFNLGDGAGGDNVVTVKNVEILEAVQDAYEDTIAKRKTGSDVHKKQSLADIFRSMDETEEDMAAQFKKELHDEIQDKQLAKGDNGKFNLAEEDSAWGDELIEDLKLLVAEVSQYDGIIDTQQILDLIEKYEI